ncbi:MAG TPA: nuclear transport factor 2 family protein [Saprospiraceae bacterium]|nr:nuclear transport factor 2 family protein [Saprospiraceae bacterium]
MKTNLVQLLMIVALGLANTSVHAQSKSEETAVKAFWKSVWQAYESDNPEKVFSFYSENACEITPDGMLTCGKKAMLENWKMFMQMVDEKPKFSYEDPLVRFITADIATITWNSNDDIKIKGQQVGGKTKGMALVHKINGKWLVEFDSITPVIQMHPN